MNAPVDVLAVLGALNLACPDQRAGLNAARAAVVGLIEAAERGLRNTEAFNSSYGSEALDADADFIRAALARVRGEA
ncbi:hypothetical protein [Stenotrophomonas acidaminiphila]|uniref:hypothetical protein n=1 Tax=Stenotrophomonas acidaminiphila TaxID=128780 RepID=UPI0015F7818F|nr:hypothetical protein [Stenotrophomonas acidaminiphila]